MTLKPPRMLSSSLFRRFSLTLIDTLDTLVVRSSPFFLLFPVFTCDLTILNPL